MSNENESRTSNLTKLSCDLVAAYVSNNSVPAIEISGLIQTVRATILQLTGISAASEAPTADIEKPTPAQIRKSVRDDGITSFIDGRVYKTLKRHLTAHGMSPATYCERYGLPANYPMVAPSYAAHRSELAKSIGLGRIGGQAERQAMRKAS